MLDEGAVAGRNSLRPRCRRRGQSQYEARRRPRTIGQQLTILIAEQNTRRHARVSARWLLLYLEVAFGLCSAMADAKIVLTVPGGRADLSGTDARWLSEHLPSDSVLLRAYCGRCPQSVARQVIRPQARWSIAR
jgi:hypothetical protein